jgi:hypothetical protein
MKLLQCKFVAILGEEERRGWGNLEQFAWISLSVGVQSLDRSSLPPVLKVYDKKYIQSYPTVAYGIISKTSDS